MKLYFQRVFSLSCCETVLRQALSVAIAFFENRARFVAKRHSFFNPF